jgi:pre-mRNA-processing factor SLU7
LSFVFRTCSEFLTKKPWYLGGEEGQQPTLEHQQVAKQAGEKTGLSLQASEAVLAQQRQALLADKKYKVGQWVEALKKNKLPYRMCQILKVNKQQTEFDLQYEDGTIEKRVKLFATTAQRPRIRRTKTGSRTGTLAVGSSTAATYDSKRDAYHGYDADTHNARVSAKFAEREALRRQFREQVQQTQKEDNASSTKTTLQDGTENDQGDGTTKSDSKGSNNNDTENKKEEDDDDSVFSAESDHDDEEEYVQRDEDDKVITTRLARQGGVGGAQMKVTARNLRIREDTAKYLRNLDLDSAYYDPKSRSMRDNPTPHIPQEESQFIGENFTRISGDAVAMAQTQLFAWEAEKKGVGEIHPQANPSQAEMLQKQFQTKAADLKLQQKKAVLDKYGGAEYLDGKGGLASASNPPSGETSTDRKLRFGVTTTKQEYSQDGRRVNGKEIKRKAIPSKYEEDIFINAHTTVWGSYFHIGAFQWGYADDHSLIKLSYCTGAEGRRANDEANEMKYGTGKAGSAALAQARRMLTASSGAGTNGGSSHATNAMMNRSKLYGEANQMAELDQAKVQAALEKSIEETTGKDQDGRKRKYNSLNAGDNLTEEDMEAYRLKKELSSDPMAKLGHDQVLDYK